MLILYKLYLNKMEKKTCMCVGRGHLDLFINNHKNNLYNSEKDGQYVV